jgi:hypothetical protein
MQPIRLRDDLTRFRRRDYVHATKWEGESPFEATFARLRSVVDDHTCSTAP